MFLSIRSTRAWLVLCVLLSFVQLEAHVDTTVSLQPCISNVIIDNDSPMPGEIRLYAKSDLPFSGTWAICDGRTLDKNTYVSLYNIIGNRYGGNGNPNFNIPKIESAITGMQYLICIDKGDHLKLDVKDSDPKMADSSYISRVAMGEIRMYAGKGLPFSGMFKECNGQLLKISEYQKGLYALIGNRYGGDGVTTFALPTITPLIKGSKYLIAVEGFFPQKQ